MSLPFRQSLRWLTTVPSRALPILERPLTGLLWAPYLLRYYAFYRHIRRLHLGCGSVRLPGWINADLAPGAQLIIDIRWPLPFPVNFFNRIYSEHVLEHVTYDRGIRFLREARRVLSPGGVIRIAMPDLDDLIEGYRGDWRRFDWVNWPQHSFIKTRAQMLNIAFRWWGHQHLYNREELARALTAAGFSRFRFVEPLVSEFEDLKGLETRKDSKLVVEAIKQ